MATGTATLDSPPPRTSLAVVANRLGIAALLVPVTAWAISFLGHEACVVSFVLIALLEPPLVLAAIGLGFMGGEEAAGGYKKGFVALPLWFLALLSQPMWGPHLCGGRPTVSNESSAVGSLRTISTACESHAGAYPKQGFPRTLQQLGPPPAGEKEGPEHAGLIDGVLASGRKSGYVFIYTPGPPDAKGVITRYTVSARPQEFKKTGSRSFYVNESGVILATQEDRAATGKDPPLQ